MTQSNDIQINDGHIYIADAEVPLASPTVRFAEFEKGRMTAHLQIPISKSGDLDTARRKVLPTRYSPVGAVNQPGQPGSNRLDRASVMRLLNAFLQDPDGYRGRVLAAFPQDPDGYRGHVLAAIPQDPDGYRARLLAEFFQDPDGYRARLLADITASPDGYRAPRQPGAPGSSTTSITLTGLNECGERRLLNLLDVEDVKLDGSEFQTDIVNAEIRFRSRIPLDETPYLIDAKESTNSILIVTAFRNAERFIGKSATRSLTQRYDNHRVVFIDDASTDNSLAVLEKTIASITDSRCREVHVVRNKNQLGPLRSRHEATLKYGNDDDIIVTVDGDDWMMHGDVLTYIDAIYVRNDCWVMYGGAHCEPDYGNVSYARPYERGDIGNLRCPLSAPVHVAKDKWRVDHIRTYRCWLYKRIGKVDPTWGCLKKNGSFVTVATDVAVMLPMLEMSGHDRVHYNPVNLYVYNRHDSNVHVLQPKLQTQTLREIFARPRFRTIEQPIHCAGMPYGDNPIFLDEMETLTESVGYGELGRKGRLGFDNKNVTVLGARYDHALGAHPPSRINLEIHGSDVWFDCRASLNDTARIGESECNFFVVADGKLVASARRVIAGDVPRRLCARLSNVSKLQLLVETDQWFGAHAVWLNPCLTTIADDRALWWEDSLGRTEVRIPKSQPCAKRCIATVVSPGFEYMTGNLLNSLRVNGNCSDALIALFAVGKSKRISELAKEHNAILVECRPLVPVGMMFKSVLYSVANVIEAEEFICIDGDMLVLGDLRSVFESLGACEEGSILACRGSNGRRHRTLGHALTDTYQGDLADMGRMLHLQNGEAHYGLVVNEGIYAAKRGAMLALDAMIRSLKGARSWIDERMDVPWRHQFVFNLALAHMDCGVELDASYNVQLHTCDVELEHVGSRPTARWGRRKARILHFCGRQGKAKYTRTLRHFSPYISNQ